MQRALGNGQMTLEIGSLRQIGVVHSPYKEAKDAPFQGKHANDECTLEVFEDYEAALLDIEQCSHLIVLYWQDRANRNVLQVRTPWGPGYTARSSNRPNPIGLCVVELLKRDGRFLKVRGMDAVEGSPLLDIKPYSPEVNCVQDAIIGWHEQRGLKPDE